MSITPSEFGGDDGIVNDPDNPTAQEQLYLQYKNGWNPLEGEGESDTTGEFSA